MQTSAQSCTANELEEKSNKADSCQAMKQWEQSWAEYFRLDETRSESELQSLCERLRSLATSIT